MPAAVVLPVAAVVADFDADCEIGGSTGGVTSPLPKEHSFLLYSTRPFPMSVWPIFLLDELLPVELLLTSIRGSHFLPAASYRYADLFRSR